MVPGRRWCGPGRQKLVPQRAPYGGCRCPLWGCGEGVPGGGAFCRCEGRLNSGALSPPAARLLGGLSGSATHVLWARVCRRRGAALSLWVACPVGGCVPLRWWEAVPGGVAFHRCQEHQALSLPRPPVLWGGRPGFRDPCFPGAVGVGVGTQHRLHSVRSCEPWLRACGGGRRTTPGGVPCAVARGVWVQAISLSWLPVLYAGCQGPLPTCCGRGCAALGGPHILGAGGWALVRLVCVVPVGCLCAGGCVTVRCVPWCRPARCCLPSSVSVVPPTLALPHGVVLAVACGRAPFQACVPRSVAGYPPSSFVNTELFTLSSTLRWPALLPG